MKVALVTLIISFLVPLIKGFASDCNPVDLRTPSLGKPQDQLSSYWCYAYVAADLLTQATGQKVSPIYIALNSIKERSEWDSINAYMAFGDSTKGGNIESTINGLNGNVCSFQSMPSGEGAINAGLSLIEKTAKLRSLPSSMQSSCQRDDVANLAALFPKGNLTDLINAVAKENIYQAWADLKARGCSDGTVKFHNLKSKTVWAYPYRDIINDLDAQLNRGKIVAIQYDPNFLLKLEYRSSRPIVDLLARKSAHYSSIVARKRIDGKCRYLVRDSSGSTCEYYEGERCDKEDPGNIWVTREELSKNTNSITYLLPSSD